jgi:pyruvate kinase
MMNRKSKIVCTLGPASQEEEVLTKMIKAGLNVARLNFSHGTHQSHKIVIDRVRRLSEELNTPVAILQDLQGPKLRVGILPKGGIELKADQYVQLTNINEDHDQPPVRQNEMVVIPMDVPALTRIVEPGNYILMDDGHLELEVVRVSGKAVEARVILGGLLTSNKGVNMPGANLDTPGFTEKDREDLEYGLQHGVDAIAISFVRSANDVDVVRQVIREISPEQSGIPIIAKMELPAAIEHMESIIQAADGIMVARGDLAVETSPASVPIIQKRLIDTANRHNRIVITATQMLESMIENPRPTRAEASDVANAVLDGSDAVMLSAESAVGRFPVESVAMMDRIVREAEQYYSEWGRAPILSGELSGDDAITTTRSAREMAQDQDVAGIAVFTKSGRTALYMSKVRPHVPVIAFTPDPRTYQRLAMLWGVSPRLVPFANSFEEMISHVDEAIQITNGFKAGQQVVLVASYPVGTGTTPNVALLHTLPDSD